MKKLRRLVYQVKSGGIVKNLNRSAFYRDAAQRYDLVYFGAVNAQSDDHTMVRGLTVSSQHRDRHYCVGSVEGYDVILLERTDLLYFPHKQPESYRWTILQIDLDRLRLPHFFIDSHQHQSAFYDALFAKFPQMKQADVNLFADHDPRFRNAFSLFCETTRVPEMVQQLTPEITATLGHHFAHYDFELYEDKLLVYSSNRAPTRQVMDNLFRAGIWLARELEKPSYGHMATNDAADQQIS